MWQSRGAITGTPPPPSHDSACKTPSDRITAGSQYLFILTGYPVNYSYLSFQIQMKWHFKSIHIVTYFRLKRIDHGCIKITGYSIGGGARSLL